MDSSNSGNPVVAAIKAALARRKADVSTKDVASKRPSKLTQPKP